MNRLQDRLDEAVADELMTPDEADAEWWGQMEDETDARRE